MCIPLDDHNAKRQTVSVPLNADLVARPAAHGINISRMAEAGLLVAFETAKIREELKEDVCFIAEHVAQHRFPFPDSVADLMPEKVDDNAACVCVNPAALSRNTATI